MRILEHFVRGKRPDQSLCEDGWVLTPDFAAVVDGSTSKLPGRHGGREAMRLVCDALRTLDAGAGKRDMLRALTCAIARHNPPEAREAGAYRLTCSAVIYSRLRRVVWMVGDCQCRFGGHTLTHPKWVDSVLTEARCDVVRALRAQGRFVAELRRHDEGRAAIADALRTQTNFQNDTNPYNPFRYPVLDGFPVDEAQVPEWPVAHVDWIVLASDGYPVLCDTLRDTEEELRRLLQADPLCVAGNAGTKAWMEGNESYDDRCYLSFVPD